MCGDLVAFGYEFFKWNFGIEVLATERMDDE